MMSTYSERELCMPVPPKKTDKQIIDEIREYYKHPHFEPEPKRSAEWEYLSAINELYKSPAELARQYHAREEERWRKANGGTLPTDEGADPERSVVGRVAAANFDLTTTTQLGDQGRHGFLLRYKDKDNTWYRATLNAPGSEVTIGNYSIGIADSFGRELLSAGIPSKEIEIEGSPPKDGPLVEVKGNRHGVQVNVESQFKESSLKLRIESGTALINISPKANNVVIDGLPGSGKVMVRIPAVKGDIWLDDRNGEGIYHFPNKIRLKDANHFGQDVDLVFYDPKQAGREMMIPIRNGKLDKVAMVEMLRGVGFSGKRPEDEYKLWEHKDIKTILEKDFDNCSEAEQAIVYMKNSNSGSKGLGVLFEAFAQGEDGAAMRAAPPPKPGKPLLR